MIDVFIENKQKVNEFITICNNKSMSNIELAQHFNMHKNSIIKIKRLLGIKSFRKTNINKFSTEFLKPIQFNIDQTIKCKCLLCNSITNQRKDVLMMGKHSCGCINGNNTTILNQLNDKYITLGWFNGFARRAKMRNWIFNLTIEYLNNLYLQQNKLCAISNVPITFSKMAGYNHKVELSTASLDRIDSTIGYVEGNVQWVHKDVNFMKQTMTDEKLINWCEIIFKYQNSLKTNKSNT